MMGSCPPREALTMPCFNEAERLDLSALLGLVDAGRCLRLIAVDDGSTDATPRLLRRLRDQRRDSITLIRQRTNQGKAESVRRGLREALAQGADIVGYFDADLSTPVDELLRLLTHFRQLDCDVLLAARVALLGRHIERHAARHYLGRVFATAASLTLGLRNQLGGYAYLFR